MGRIDINQKRLQHGGVFLFLRKLNQGDANKVFSRALSLAAKTSMSV